jgi:hypothetical protein
MSSSEKQDLSLLMRKEQIEFQKELAEVNKKIDNQNEPELSTNYNLKQVENRKEIEKIAKELNIDISKYETRDLYQLNTLNTFKNKMVQHIVAEQKKLIQKLADYSKYSQKESSATLKI